MAKLKLSVASRDDELDELLTKVNDAALWDILDWALDREAPATKIQQAQAHLATVDALLIEAQTALKLTVLQADRVRVLLTMKINMGIGLRNEMLALEVREGCT